MIRARRRTASLRGSPRPINRRLGSSANVDDRVARDERGPYAGEVIDRWRNLALRPLPPSPGRPRGRASRSRGNAFAPRRGSFYEITAG